MKNSSNTQIKVGLGEAISRLLKIELLKQNKLYEIPDDLIRERELIYSALDEVKIDLFFDCDGDGIPDTIEIFERSTKDSCCKIIKSDKKSSKKRNNRKK